MEQKQIETALDNNANAKTLIAITLPATAPTTTVVWKERIHNFSWQWHVVVMATGVCSSLFHSFPYHNGSLTLRIISMSFFLFDLCLFALLGIWGVARCIVFPKDRMLIFTDPATSLFIGFFTNGAASLINAGLNVNRDWGTGRLGLLYALWGLWWLDCVLACLIACGLVYLTICQRCNDLAKVRPSWMVPVITLITMSSSGALFTRSLLPYSPKLAALSLSISFSMLAIGLSFTMMLTTAFLLRLYLHGPLDATIVLTTFTTLTPLGQGGFSMLMNGQDIANLLAEASLHPESQLVGNVVYSVCICGAYILWSMGIAWIVVACFSICKHARNIPQFSISHWCIVVPNGVFASLSLQLATALDSSFFRVFGAGWACIAFVLWTGTFCRTVVAIWYGSIFKPRAPRTSAATSDGVIASIPPSDSSEKEAQLGFSEQVEVLILSECLPTMKSSDVESLAETLCCQPETIVVREVS